MEDIYSPKRKIIVIIPAYNEEDNIHDAVVNIRAIENRLVSRNSNLFVYVVNDGSTDNTKGKAIKSGANRVINHNSNQGLGAAVRTGLTMALDDGADIVVKIDADLQHDPTDIIALIAPIVEDEADIVYGNRFEKIGYKMPLIRKIGNMVFTGLMRWLTHWPIKDSQPGIFAVNRNYLIKCNIPGNYNYTQQILLDAYHNGMRFTHVPVNFKMRTTGQSFVSLKYPFKVLPQIIMVLVGIKPMRVFAPIGFIFLFIGFVTFSFELLSWFVGKSHKPVIHVNAVMGLGFFGLQTLFFGILAELIVRSIKK